jgi:two-component sensor histidine kinase/PAS domain-containing protein
MNISILLLCLNAGISVILAVAAFQRRSVPGSLPLVFLMLAAALWSLNYAFELYSSNFHTQLLLVKIQYLGIVFIPVAAFFISVSYKTQRKIKRLLWKVVVFSIVPLLVLFSLWTNELHKLFYSNIWTSGESITFFRAYGPVFWLHALYAYLLMSISVYNLLDSYKKLPDIFRKQTTVMLIASLIPWIINLLYITQVFNPAVDPTPFALTASGITLSIGLFYLNLFQPIPIAENHIVNILKDIVLILTPQHHILKLNSAAERILNYKTDQVLGQPLQEISKDIFDAIQNTAALDSEEYNIILNKKSTPHYYQCHVSPLYNKKNKLIAKIILLSDISHIKKTELALKKLNQELESRINERTKELAQANDSLQQQIAQKELLLTELNHRVKNNLSIIRSLITLQASSIKDKRTVRKLDDLKNRITSIGLIYKKLYSKADISHIDLKNYLHELLAELNSSLSHDKINFGINTELVEMDVAVDIVIPIGLIVTELVINSSKYAFSGDNHNTIAVTTAQSKDRLTITVYDNGCGYPEKVLKSKSNTLGLSLIQLLIKQLNGSITFCNKNGACSVFEIPLK